MLSALRFELPAPTHYQYLARLLKAAGAQCDKPLALFVAYCAELALVDYSCLRYGASDLAAGIMYVALTAFGRSGDAAYPRPLAVHAGRGRADALAAAKEVVGLVQRAPGSHLQAVRKKYSSPKFCKAAAVAPPVSILEE